MVFVEIVEFSDLRFIFFVKVIEMFCVDGKF